MAKIHYLRTNVTPTLIACHHNNTKILQRLKFGCRAMRDPGCDGDLVGLLHDYETMSSCCGFPTSSFPNFRWVQVDCSSHVQHWMIADNNLPSYQHTDQLPNARPFPWQVDLWRRDIVLKTATRVSGGVEGMGEGTIGPSQKHSH